MPYGSVLGPVLYLVHSNDIPKNRITMYAVSTALLATGDGVIGTTKRLQRAVNKGVIV